MCVRAGRQAHREDRAFARLARHRHVTAHHARELPREGKAEPRSAVAPRGQGIGLGEVLEQSSPAASAVMPMPVSATANSTQSRPSATLRTRSATSPCFGELAGIAQQIEQDLLEPHGIRVERARGSLGLRP